MIDVGKRDLVDVGEARNEALAATDVKLDEFNAFPPANPATFDRNARTLDRSTDAARIVLR